MAELTILRPALLQIDGLQALGALPNVYRARDEFKATSANSTPIDFHYLTHFDARPPSLILAPPNELLKKMIKGMEGSLSHAEQVVHALPRDKSFQCFTIDLDDVIGRCGDEPVAEDMECSSLRFVGFLHCCAPDSILSSQSNDAYFLLSGQGRHSCAWKIYGTDHERSAEQEG
mgnify:CR=1 FL=1